MILSLEARGFRNLEDFRVELEPGCTLFAGPTGAGKTSLLEAMYLVATTRSFRATRLQDCVRATQEGAATEFFLSAEVDRDRRSTLQLAWSAKEGASRRVNDRSTGLAAHLEVLPLLAWSAGEAETLVGSPQLRRRLLDRGVVSCRPTTLEVLSRYRRALEQKKLLLARRRHGAHGSQSVGDQGVEGWNELLARAGSELLELRSGYVERLARALQEVLADSSLGWSGIELSYQPSPRGGVGAPADFLQEVERHAATEQAQGRALVGPHRDRFELIWQGRPVRHRASAGERKALGLLLLAAQTRLLFEVQRDPVLVLDDFDAEMDVATLHAVLEVFSGVPQVFLSTNRPAVFEGLSIERCWKIDKGRIDSR